MCKSGKSSSSFKECQSIPSDASLRYQCKGVKEVLHAQWAKERLVQNQRVNCSSIQENIRLPVSLRPHQKTRELRAIQSITICKPTAPQSRVRAIWPKWTHPTGVITIRNAPKLVTNFPGPGSIVLPWPPQVYNNEM